MRVNHNISAVIANNNLLVNEDRLATSLEKLSSGLRINAAKDDPTGMAISVTMKAQIDGMMKAFPEVEYRVIYGEESFAALLRSERNLSHLLTIVTIVAILIAVFGVYSIITLACRQRRKEIALRKIHGAKLKDILGMFVKEYGLILVIGAAVAFPVGYLIMHGWLEQYLKRITIGPLFYIGIFVAKGDPQSPNGSRAGTQT